MPDFDTIPGIIDLWQLTLGDPRIKIAMLDGHPEMSHPCLASANLQLLAPYWLDGEVAIDEKEKKQFSDHLTDHATGVASILLSPHDTAVKGLAPNCHGLAIPLGQLSRTLLSPLNLVRALDLARDSGVNVIHMAPCLPNQAGQADSLLANAVRACVEANILLVAPTGNNRGESWCFPAALSGVLPVGALRDDGQAFLFTNWGTVYNGRGVMAHGENILVANSTGGTERQKGTSCAAPIVSGVAALLMSLQLKQGRAVDAAEVRRVLVDTALPCDPPDREDCQRWIGGQLNVPGAMQAILNPDDRSHPAKAPTSVNRDRDRDWVKILPPRAIDAMTNPYKPKDADEGERVADAKAEQSESTVEAHAVIAASSNAALPPAAMPGTKVFALGRLGYDFGSQARCDTFRRLMPPVTTDNSFAPASPYDPRQLAAFLENHPDESPSLIWTLNADQTPVYAIEPRGPYATDVYRILRLLLLAQTAPADNPGFVERVSIPGYVSDRSVRLLSGQTLPVIELPGARGAHGWSVDGLIGAALGSLPEPVGEEEATVLRQALAAFMNRIYHDRQNLGVTSRDRALNYCATNLVQAATVFREALSRGMGLDTVSAEKSPYCRQNSDCWDVKLRFFDPDSGKRARRAYRFTIDVSELTPVTVGEVRSWSEMTSSVPVSSNRVDRLIDVKQ